jgi:hypothetical protein
MMDDLLRCELLRGDMRVVRSGGVTAAQAFRCGHSLCERLQASRRLAKMQPHTRLRFRAGHALARR